MHYVRVYAVIKIEDDADQQRIMSLASVNGAANRRAKELGFEVAAWGTERVDYEPGNEPEWRRTIRNRP